MIEGKKAAFTFEEFKVPQFSYNEANNVSSNIKIGFIPKGEYSASTGIFHLELNFITHESEQEDNIIFELRSIGKFKFEAPIDLQEIPPYFYKNAIAIMFPYLRAFISTLTLQANTKLLRLGLMNLSNLERPLMENTVEV